MIALINLVSSDLCAAVLYSLLDKFFFSDRTHSMHGSLSLSAQNIAFSRAPAGDACRFPGPQPVNCHHSLEAIIKSIRTYNWPTVVQDTIWWLEYNVFGADLSHMFFSHKLHTILEFVQEYLQALLHTLLPKL